MVDAVELVKRLRSEVEYDNDKSDGPGEITYGRVFEEAATAIEALVAERDEARLIARLIATKITADSPAAARVSRIIIAKNMAEARALSAESKLDRAKEALRDILEWDDKFRATMSPSTEKDPVTRACDRARSTLDEIDKP